MTLDRSPMGAWAQAIEHLSCARDLLAQMRMDAHPGRTCDRGGGEVSLADVHGQALEVMVAAVRWHWEQTLWIAATDRTQVVVEAPRRDPVAPTTACVCGHTLKAHGDTDGCHWCDCVGFFARVER